jgi:Ankyrin repeats (3 copies)
VTLSVTKQIDSWKAPASQHLSIIIMLMLLAPASVVDDVLLGQSSVDSLSSYLKTSIWYWIVAMVAVKIVWYSFCHRARMSLLRWVLQAVERWLGAPAGAEQDQHHRWSAVFLAWLDEWCCLPLECTSSNDPENKKLDDQLPSFCCPKRRARWEKNWQRKCARHQHNPKDSCFLSKLFFCLPPPLPLRAAGEQQHTSRSITETTTIANDSVPEEPVLHEDADVAHPIEPKQSKPSTAPTSDVSAGPTTVALVQPRRAAPPPIVHLIDQVRMQQWSTLLAQPKWRRRQVKYRDTDGLYPLHWAAAGGSPVAVVDRLLKTAGHIAHYPDNEGSLPLHFAAHYAASRDVLAALWRAYPKAIFHRDRYGRTPLYHAVDKSLSLATLQLLIQNSSTTRSDTTEEATAATPATSTTPHYELITTPCYTPQGSTRREQATRTPLFMVWASVLNNREARVKWRGKTWDKAVWMLQHSYRYHYADLATATTTADLLSSSLVSICLRMDLYLPDPVVPLVLANAVPGGVNNRLADLVVAAATPSYSLERILELIHHFRQVNNNDDDDDVNGTAALAAARAGQPWEVLERLPHRDRHALAIVSALATPIVYEQMSMLHSNAPFQQDPLGLLRRLHTPQDKSSSSSSSSSSSTEETTTNPTTTTIRPVAVDPPPNNNGVGSTTTTMETVYRLLRENPGQLLLRTATKAPSS